MRDKSSFNTIIIIKTFFFLLFGYFSTFFFPSTRFKLGKEICIFFAHLHNYRITFAKDDIDGHRTNSHIHKSCAVCNVTHIHFKYWQKMLACWIQHRCIHSLLSLFIDHILVILKTFRMKEAKSNLFLLLWNCSFDDDSRLNFFLLKTILWKGHRAKCSTGQYNAKRIHQNFEWHDKAAWLHQIMYCPFSPISTSIFSVLAFSVSPNSFRLANPNFNSKPKRRRKHSNEFNLTRTVWCPRPTKQHKTIVKWFSTRLKRK